MLAWLKEFAARYPLPDRYLTLDLETSGLSPQQNQICAYGAALVEDRQIKSTVEMFLNWPDHLDIDAVAFATDVARTEAVMREQGKPYHCQVERLRSQGVPPLDALRSLLSLLELSETTHIPLVLHNGWKFDLPFIQHSLYQWLGVGWQFLPNQVFDTGAMMKAAQLYHEGNSFPEGAETLKDWALRISRLRRKGVYWALHGFCDEQFGLLKRANIMPEQMHLPSVDALLLHHLFEAIREVAAA